MTSGSSEVQLCFDQPFAHSVFRSKKGANDAMDSFLMDFLVKEYISNLFLYKTKEKIPMFEASITYVNLCKFRFGKVIHSCHFSVEI